MTYTCAKCHSESTDSDYCSVCGARMAGAPSALNTAIGSAPAVAPPGVATTGGGEICPDCGTPRSGSAKFCEVCRYNFETQASGIGAPPPPTPAPPPPLPDRPNSLPVEAAPVVTSPLVADLPTAAVAAIGDAIPATPQQGADAALLAKWELHVVVDPSLYTDPDPQLPCPVGEPERAFPLDFVENLIGRRSDRKDIHPEIPLNDPGVSHRHAKLLRQADGGFVLLDVGSTNGTHLNEVEVKPGVRTPLQEGDQITLGCWTRITLRKQP